MLLLLWLVWNDCRSHTLANTGSKKDSAWMNEWVLTPRFDIIEMWRWMKKKKKKNKMTTMMTVVTIVVVAMTISATVTLALSQWQPTIAMTHSQQTNKHHSINLFLFKVAFYLLHEQKNSKYSSSHLTHRLKDFEAIAGLKTKQLFVFSFSDDV